MANIIETVSGSQQNQTNSINHGFVAVQSAALFGIKGSETEELTLTLYGGIWSGAVLAEQSVTLTDNATNYVEATLAGVVSANQSAFTPGRIPLYTFTIANDGGIDFDNYVDYRDWRASSAGLRGLTFIAETGSTADSDPGAGLFKWNHATQGSATVLYFDDATADGISLTTFWASLPPGGFITLQQADDPTKWQLWKWTATPVDGTGYRKFTATLQASGGSIADAKLVFVSFVSRSANAALDALAALTPAANKGVLFTSGSAASLIDISAVAQTLLAQTTRALMRSTGLGLDVLTAQLMNYGGYQFDGSTDYLSTNALTGITDTKKGTFVAVVRFANSASATEFLHCSSGDAFRISRSATGNIQVIAENAGGTVILNQTLTGTPCAAAGTYVIMLSWDLATPGSIRMYVNDVTGTITPTTFTDDTIDYTVAENRIGANMSAANKFTGDMYVYWFDELVNLDFSSASVRRAFTDVNNVPLFLGRNGELPTGTTPRLFHAYDPYTQWAVPRGLVQSTWTENGTPGAPGTTLYGQWAPLYTVGVIKTVTADYTVGATDEMIINNRGATNTLTLPAANTCKHRKLRVKTIQAQTVVSASSNVVPRPDTAAGTAILGASDGAWADLQSDGTNWIITAGS